MKKALVLTLLSFTLTLLPAVATLRLSSPFSDGMVLQQNSNARIWGWAKPNAKVTARASWNNKAVSATADANGRWQLSLATPAGSFTPYQVTLAEVNKVILHNVLVGEVWIGSGQSNMEMSLAGRQNRVIENINREILGANNYSGKLHLAIVEHNAQACPQDTCTMHWQDCSSATVAPWSAVCYFFATTLIDALHCPVGIIETCWGGTSVESWSPADVLPAPVSENDKKDYSVRYNGMIHPLLGYTVSGFIWYQGEANVGRNQLYAAQLAKTITAWRKAWQLGDLPFYQVEICPYYYDKDVNGINGALLREAQDNVTLTTPNTGMVCTNDLVKPYEVRQIHPMMKREVGERLACMALGRHYHVPGLFTDYPRYNSMTVKNDNVILSLSNCKQGFNRFDDIQGFEICGTDKHYYPAHASVNGTDIVLSAPKVRQPVAVRYCFRNFQLGNLTNIGGLPLIPFRTDK